MSGSRDAGDGHAKSIAKELLSGVRDGTPLASTALIDGPIFGSAAVGLGLGAGSAVAFSAVALSGTGQFASLAGWNRPLPWLFATVLILSARLVPLSFALMVRLRTFPLAARLLVALLVTEETFAVAVTRSRLSASYAAGAGLVLWAGWVVGTLVGVVGGRLITAPGFVESAIAVLFTAFAASQIRSASAMLLAACAVAVTVVMNALGVGIAGPILSAALVIPIAIVESKRRG